MIHFDEPFQIFFEDRKQDWDDLYYCCWIEMLYSAIKGLQFYDTEKKQFTQAHIWAAWAIFMAVRDVTTITFCKDADGKDSFVLGIKREQLRSHGFEKLSKFLGELHILKSIGDYESAEIFFNKFSQVDDEMLKVREIVVANKQPRRMELQPNLLMQNEMPEYKDYEESFSGIIQSYVDRFPAKEIKECWEQWSKDWPHQKHM